MQAVVQRMQAIVPNGAGKLMVYRIMYLPVMLQTTAGVYRVRAVTRPMVEWTKVVLWFLPAPVLVRAIRTLATGPEPVAVTVAAQIIALVAAVAALAKSAVADHASTNHAMEVIADR
jgi:bacteriorhodopsin